MRRRAATKAATPSTIALPPTTPIPRSGSALSTTTAGSAPPVLAPAPRVPPFPDLSSSFLPPLSPGLFGLVGVVGFAVGEAVGDGDWVGDVVGLTVGEVVGVVVGLTVGELVGEVVGEAVGE